MTRAIGRNLLIGSIAGLAGGVAEVGWISLYAAMTDRDAGVVARGVAAAVRVGDQAASEGVAIHMALAAGLGIALAFALGWVRDLRAFGLYAAVTAALAVVWAVNFMVLLPVISPQFVDIVPMGVSFLSKILFGVAAAACFQMAQRATPRFAH